MFGFFSFAGTDAWPQGSYLRFLQGHVLGSRERQDVRSLEPQEVANISVQMHSPKECGLYQGQWRMCAQNGMFFGGNFIVFNYNNFF